MTNHIESNRGIVRHAIATVAYRGARTIGDAPSNFGSYRVKPESRTPVEIVAQMGDLFDWALSMAQGQEKWRNSPQLEWNQEVARFYASVNALDTYLASAPVVSCPLERLLQGPIADAISHVGQLAMLRHLFGAPIIRENYYKADIHIGQVELNQPPPPKVLN